MKFTAETGIEVTYLEDINANEEFFAASLAGPLDAGLPTDWDIVVLTDWMIGRLVRLGWLEAIDKANTPNFAANLAPTYVGRTFDPETKFAAPWQSGMTGLGFDKSRDRRPDLAGRVLHDRVRGQDHVPQRDARHGRAHGHQPGGRPGRLDPGRIRCRACEGRRGDPVRDRPAGRRR